VFQNYADAIPGPRAGGLQPARALASNYTAGGERVSNAGNASRYACHEQPTPAPTASVPADWQTYMDQQYGFTFRYPKEGQIFSQENGYARINGLPFAPGTNLVEKYLEVNVAENANPCSSPLTQGYAPGYIQSQQVTINGLAWVIEGGEDAGAGQIHTWTAYSTVKGNACVSLSFILHSTNPGMYSTPPPLFDEAAESAVFADIVFTFVWLNP